MRPRPPLALNAFVAIASDRSAWHHVGSMTSVLLYQWQHHPQLEDRKHHVEKHNRSSKRTRPIRQFCCCVGHHCWKQHPRERQRQLNNPNIEESFKWTRYADQSSIGQSEGGPEAYDGKMQVKQRAYDSQSRRRDLRRLLALRFWT